MKPSIDPLGTVIQLGRHRWDEGDAMPQPHEFLHRCQLMRACRSDGRDQMPIAEATGLISQAMGLVQQHERLLS